MAVIKPHFILSTIFCKPKNPIDFEEQRGLVYKISHDRDAAYIGEMGHKCYEAVQEFDQPEKISFVTACL